MLSTLALTRFYDSLLTLGTIVGAMVFQGKDFVPPSSGPPCLFNSDLFPSIAEYTLHACVRSYCLAWGICGTRKCPSLLVSDQWCLLRLASRDIYVHRNVADDIYVVDSTVRISSGGCRALIILSDQQDNKDGRGGCRAFNCIRHSCFLRHHRKNSVVYRRRGLESSF